MHSLKPKTAGWIGGVLLFAAVGFSMVAFFQSNIWDLLIAIVCLIPGFFLIRYAMSN